MDFIEKVKLFNEIGGTPNEFSIKKSTLYVGLILEEVAELLESFNNSTWDSNINHLNALSLGFKRGDYDEFLESENFDKVEALDAVCDIAVVSLGLGISLGADVNGACHAVADNNLSKFNLVGDVYEVLYDSNGKIKKPDNYVSVKLDSFIKIK